MEIKNHEKHINASFRSSQELRIYLRPFVEAVLNEQPGLSSKNTVKEVIRRAGRGSNATVADLYTSVLRARSTAHRLKERCYIDGPACDNAPCPNGYNPLGCEEHRHARIQAHNAVMTIKGQKTLIEAL